MTVPRSLRRLVLGISPAETLFSRRGFRAADPRVQDRLEQIGATFLTGYHAALEARELRDLARELNEVELERRGFAFEGAAMALTLLDHIAPWPGERFQRFVHGPGAPHIYMLHVGAGWAYARLPWLRAHIERPLSRLDPRFRWLALDGYGFHEGYFYAKRRVTQAELPRQLTGYAIRAFDQGLGRSLWFVDGADAGRIPSTIAAFPAARHSDLWSGVGLACAYAGGADETGVQRLFDRAGPHQCAFAQGIVFAAKARQRAGNPAAHTGMVCRQVCGVSADALAAIADETVKGLPADGAEPAYEIWRKRVQTELTGVRR
jgi:hypothetical protein